MIVGGSICHRWFYAKTTIDHANIGVGIRGDIRVGWQRDMNIAALTQEHKSGRLLRIGKIWEDQSPVECDVALPCLNARTRSQDGVADGHIARAACDVEDTAQPINFDLADWRFDVHK